MKHYVASFQETSNCLFLFLFSLLVLFLLILILIPILIITILNFNPTSPLLLLSTHHKFSYIKFKGGRRGRGGGVGKKIGNAEKNSFDGLTDFNFR